MVSARFWAHKLRSSADGRLRHAGGRFAGVRLPRFISGLFARRIKSPKNRRVRHEPGVNEMEDQACSRPRTQESKTSRAFTGTDAERCDAQMIAKLSPARQCECRPRARSTARWWTRMVVGNNFSSCLRQGRHTRRAGHGDRRTPFGRPRTVHHRHRRRRGPNRWWCSEVRTPCPGALFHGHDDPLGSGHA